jgi:hypothetical protein
VKSVADRADQRHQAQPSESRLAWRAAGLILIALGTLGAYRSYTGTISTGWPSTAIAIGIGSILATSAGCVALWWSSVARHTVIAAFLHIGPAWIVYIAITFGLTSATWIRRAPTTIPIVAPRSILLALVSVDVAIVSWTAGYLLPIGLVLATWLRKFASPEASPNTWKAQWLPIPLYAVAIGARLIRLHAGRLGYLQDPTLALLSPSTTFQVLAILDDFAMLAILLAAMDAFALSRSRRARVIMVTLVVTEVGFGLITASKETVLWTVIAPGLMYVVTKRRVPRTLLAAFMVIAVFDFAFTSAYRKTIRNSARTTSTSLSAAAKNFPSTLAKTLDQNPFKLSSGSGGSAAARLRQIDNVTLVIDRTPSRINYVPWTQLVVGPIEGAIPRAVWPTKPIISTGLQFSQDYYDIPPQVLTASAVTMPGDLIRHGGAMPLIVGMLVLGIIAAIVDCAFSPLADPKNAVILIPVLLVFVKSEADVVSLLLSVVPSILLGMLVVRLAFGTSKGRNVDRVIS